MENLVRKIKEKYELNSLPDSLVKSTLETYLLKNKVKYINSEKSQKIIVKEVRKELRRYTGQYASKTNIKNRQELIKKEDIIGLLKEHSSTRERLEDYPLVKDIIKKINPKSILDLGCGVNPIAIASKGIKYHAYDINQNDLEIVNEFFKINKIEGDIYHKDIREESLFPKVDLCIIFKVLDILGDDRNKVTKDILTKVDSKYFLISFATRTLSGKPMNSPYRRWFEKILQVLNYKYEVKRTRQELFYIIQKTTA
ncbi:MAG: methyltransferase [Nanoarchaeota archaeon]